MAVMSIQTFSPPIKINNAAIHSIDPTAHKLSIVFYVNSSPELGSMDITSQEKLREELEGRFKVLLQYLSKEGFIDPKISNWNAVSGVMFGKMPN